MSELPKGWVETTIGALIFNMIGGASPKKENYSISGTLALNKGDIKENGIIKIKDQANYLPQEFVDKHVSKKVSTGAILVTLRDLSQKADFLGLISTYRGINEALITQGMYALNTSDFIIDDLLVLYSNTIFYRLYVKQEKIGATQVHLRNEQFLNIPFPLAPLAEQKRIVEKLDQVLAQVDTIKARLDGIPAILKRFRESVLAAAVSGKLTEEWRWGVKADYKNLKVEDIAGKQRYSLGIGPFGSNLKVDDYELQGHPLVFVREIRSKVFKSDKTKFVSDSKFEELKAHRVKPGDILITKMGDPPGDVAIYPNDRPEAVITADCIKLTVDPATAITRYVAYAMESSLFQKAVLAISAGVAQQKVNLKKFRIQYLPIPSLEEQIEIVRLVDQYFAFADTIEKQVQKAQQRVDKLTQSILAKAFRGELVSQNPDDEPADQLLKRIATARTESEALAKAAKNTAKKVGKG